MDFLWVLLFAISLWILSILSLVVHEEGPHRCQCSHFRRKK